MPIAERSDDALNNEWIILSDDGAELLRYIAPAAIDTADAALVLGLEIQADIASGDEPPPPRRRVGRRTIVERLAEADLLDEAEAALLAAPTLTRWKWNTALEGVFADDPETVAFLKAIGADPDLILAP